MNVINQFQNEYRFLSNFWLAPVTYNGITYQSNEAAFHAQKSLDEKQRLFFATLSPVKAKNKGRKLELRHDWEEIKLTVMYEIVKAKFEQNPYLGMMLVATGDAMLIEGNEWHDKFWGIDLKTGEGENHLGKILMRVRSELSQTSLYC